MKRDDVLSWDQYFMAVAHLSALRSKDPNTRVGACIVNPEKRIVGLGYNGFPMGCDDDVYSWEREGEYLDTKYPYVVHAELNAILNSIQNLKGCTLYVSLFPCNECAKAIISRESRKSCTKTTSTTAHPTTSQARKCSKMRKSSLSGCRTP